MVDLARLEGPRQYGARRIDRRRSFRDGDGLRLRAHDEFDLNRQRLVHVESDILLHKAFKAGSRCLDGVPADGKVVDTILPITVYRRRPGETGIKVGCLHSGRVDHRALLILHRTDDGPGRLLSCSRQQGQSKEHCEFSQGANGNRFGALQLIESRPPKIRAHALLLVLIVHSPRRNLGHAELRTQIPALAADAVASLVLPSWVALWPPAGLAKEGLIGKQHREYSANRTIGVSTRMAGSCSAERD